MSHEVLGATSIHVVLQYSDINENLPFHSLFEVLFDLWQTMTAMMTDHVSVQLNGFFCNTQFTITYLVSKEKFCFSISRTATVSHFFTVY